MNKAAYQSRSIEDFRNTRAESLAQQLEFMSKQGALNPDESANGLLDSSVEVARRFCWGAPKMAHLLAEVWRVVLGGKCSKPADKRKLMVFMQSPKTAEVVYKLLSYIGVTIILLSGDMTPSEREDLILKFNEEDDPKILIATHSLNIAGYDCQDRCSSIVIPEPAYS